MSLQVAGLHAVHRVADVQSSCQDGEHHEYDTWYGMDGRGGEVRQAKTGRAVAVTYRWQFEVGLMGSLLHFTGGEMMQIENSHHFRISRAFLRCAIAVWYKQVATELFFVAKRVAYERRKNVVLQVLGAN